MGSEESYPILLGSISFDQNSIDAATTLMGDDNQIHRSGIVPFYLIEGRIAPQITKWATKQGHDITDPKITDNSNIYKKFIRVDRTYILKISLDHDESNKKATILCGIFNGNSSKLHVELAFSVKYR